VEALFRALQPRLLRYLTARIGQAADDVASQTWLETVRVLPAFTGDADAFRALLFTVARRRTADHRRTQRRRHEAAVDELPDVAARGDLEEDVAAGLASDAAVQCIVATLPADQADVVLLRVVAGLSVDEVAQVVGKRPGTVRVVQHRALRRLAVTLGNDAEMRES
jgi:RNA polymerase sigma-70 factor, ECF subfamily